MVLAKGLLLFLLSIIVYAQHEGHSEVNQALNIINRNFREKVTGGYHDFWELKDVLYFNRRLADKAKIRMILLLRNMFTNELSLHNIKASQDIATANFTISKHKMPAFKDGTILIEKLDAASADEDFALMEKPQMQQITWTPTAKFDVPET